MNQNYLLKVKNVSVQMDDHKIIDYVSFEVRPQEVLAVIGPNGAGKTVLLKALLNLLPRTKGEVVWAPEAKIGYLPQRFHVDSYLPMRAKEFLNLSPAHSRSIEEAIELVQL